MTALLPFQLTIEQSALIVFVLAGAVIAWLLRNHRDKLLRGVPDISAEALGLFRFFYGLAMVIALNYYDQRGEEVTPRDYQWWGSWGWIDDFSTNGDLVSTVKLVTTVALVMFAIGLLTRVALAVSTAGILLYVLYILEGSGAHHWGLPFIVLISLNLVTTWGHGLSVDEAIRRLRGRSPPAERRGTAYGLGIWLPGFVWGVGFAAAAFAKLRNSGIEWGTGGAVQYHFVEDGDGAPTSIGLWIASHETIAILFSTGALAIEFALIGHIFFRSPWIRLAFSTIAVGILVGFFFFQGVFWFPWWALLLAFLPWEQIYRAGRNAMSRYVVLIDGTCPLCRRTARRLHALDLFGRLEFADAADPAQLGRYAPQVDAEAARRDMHAVRIEDGRVLTGFDAYAAMALSIPPLWPLGLLALLPPVRAVGRRVYRRVADARTLEECSDDTCALHGARRGSKPEAALPPSWRLGRAPIVAAFGTPVLIALTFFIAEQSAVSWAGEEREPLLSNYPMYSYTFDSREEFEKRNENLPRFNDFAYTARIGGKTVDVTERVRTTGFQDIFESTLLDPEYEADPDDIEAARRNYEAEYKEPVPEEITARRIRIKFDWDDGEFVRIRTRQVDRLPTRPTLLASRTID